MSDAVESRGLMRRLFEAKSLEEMSAPTKIVVYAILGLWTLVVLFPLYWVFVTSFKIEVQVDSGPFYIPFVDFKPTLDAWNFMLLAEQHARPLSQLDHSDALEHGARAPHRRACGLCAGAHPF